MTRPLRIQYSDAFYHVTCRGNERREIFLDKEDRSGFLKMLARYIDIFGVQLAACDCMPNHFYLLVCTPKANLSEFMRHFNISYKESYREQPALRELGKVITPNELSNRYANLVEMKREELTKKGRQSTERSMLMELLYRFCRITKPEIGRLLGGIDYSAVSRA